MFVWWEGGEDMDQENFVKAVLLDVCLESKTGENKLKKKGNPGQEFSNIKAPCT